MIQVEQVSKSYGKHRVLSNVSFTINKGAIAGFLGQNGAGKTTLMRVMTSFLKPDSGRVLIGGEDVQKNSMSARRKIGYLPETPPLYDTMTVREYMTFAARLRDVAPANVKSAVDRAVATCELTGVMNKPIGVLSKGFRQRVGIAQAIVHDPEVLILDEPTNGLDPVQIRSVRALIRGMERNRTVILSTHVLSEIETLAGRIIMIDRGEIVADEELSSLTERHDGKSLEDIFLSLTRSEKEVVV